MPAHTGAGGAAGRCGATPPGPPPVWGGGSGGGGGRCGCSCAAAPPAAGAGPVGYAAPGVALAGAFGAHDA
eukprot:5608124-Pleurochrysis_carterae.AAC.1